MSRRVVITGRGIVSCVGNTLDEVAIALREGRSGIRHAAEFAEAGLKSEVAGVPSLDGLPPVERSKRRFMADSALYAYHAARAAIAEAGLAPAQLTDERTGLVVGSGSTSSFEIGETVALARARGARKVLPYTVPRLMGNTTSANLATAFGIRGASYSIVTAKLSYGLSNFFGLGDGTGTDTRVTGTSTSARPMTWAATARPSCARS